MPELILKEQFESRRIRQGRDGIDVTLVYLINTADPDEALTIAPAYGSDYPLTATVSGLNEAKCVDVEIEPYTGDRCKMVVKYAPLDKRKSPLVGGEVWEWELSAQQQTIYNVRKWTDQFSYPASAATTAIGIDGENVSGASVYRPYEALTVSKEFMGFTATQRRNIKELSSKVNASSWPPNKGYYQAGEVLFLGAVISKAPCEKWRVSYRFLVGTHQENVQFDLIGGNTLDVPLLKAWQYVWFQFAKEEHTDGGETFFRQGIRSVHIADVYEEGNFSVLGLKGPEVAYV